MKSTYLERGSLTAFALVAALAVSARANGPVTSALQHHGPALPRHSMFPRLLPGEVCQIDDGASENAVGLTLGGDLICLNEFPVSSGNETITSINIAWGTPTFPDPTSMACLTRSFFGMTQTEMGRLTMRMC